MNGKIKEAIRILLVLGIIAVASFGTVTALPAQTDTGFVYPTGTKGPYLYCGWLSAYPEYPFDGYYHIGQDMEANVNTNIYAIADGEIIYVDNGNAWNSIPEDKNYGIFVKHKLNNGKEFVALYGHIRPINIDLMRNGKIDPPVKVYSGVSFATIGPFGSIPHLHFGIYPGLDFPLSNWGRMPISQPGANGFVDPTEWITTKQPFPVHGLQASYYNEPIYRNNLETVAKPDAVRIDPNLNFAWHINPSQRPAEIINDGWWSGDWKGYVKIDEPGTYRFRLESDDGSWLYIDGTMLINNGGDHSQSAVEKDLELKKGYHSVLVKYFESYGGEAVLKLEWKPPGKSAFALIPLESFYVSAPKEQPTILKVSKKAPAAMSSGSEMTYTLYYQNFGGAYDSAAVLEDKLPTEVDFIFASDGKVPNAERVISWNIDSVAAFPQGLGSKTITVRINPDKVIAVTTVIENTVTIKYGDQSFETKTTTAVVKSNLPESVIIDNTRNNIGGETSVFWQDPITFNYYSSCAESVAINIHMNEGGSDISGAMTETEDNKWSYTVPKFAPNHGGATVTYTITGCEKTSVNFNIYIDPAGFIINP